MKPPDMSDLVSGTASIPIKFAVAHSDDGCELTVFEDGKACTIELSTDMAKCLAELLTRDQ